MECKLMIGQKVVCIKDNWKARTGQTPADYGYKLWPKKGKVYTIFDIACYGELEAVSPGAHLRLVECGDPWFWHANFKPLTEPDISIFQEMLKKNIHQNLTDATRKVDKFDKIKAGSDV